jgi:hypothetical protein
MPTATRAHSAHAAPEPPPPTEAGHDNFEFFRARLKDDPRDPVTIGFMVVNARLFLRDDYVCDETWQEPLPSLPPAFYRWLEIACATPSAGDIEVLGDLAAAMLRNHVRLPECLETFAAKVLSGELKRPTKRGPDKFKNAGRDEKLWQATELIADLFGVPRYVNNHEVKDDAPSARITAAEIVSRAARCGVHAVIKACRKKRRELGAS